MRLPLKAEIKWSFGPVSRAGSGSGPGTETETETGPSSSSLLHIMIVTLLTGQLVSVGGESWRRSLAGMLTKAVCKDGRNKE